MHSGLNRLILSVSAAMVGSTLCLGGAVPCLLAQERVSRESPKQDFSAPIFFDAQESAGLDFQHFNGMTGELYLPEITGSRGEPFAPLGQSNHLFQNTGALLFRDVTYRAGASFRLKEVSRGAALGDVDNDGDTDNWL